MPQGVGGLVYLSDEDENVSQVSRAGRAYFSDSYTRIKNHFAVAVSSASGGSTLESVDIGLAYLRSESGNAPMWWGGNGDDAPYSGRGFPLWGGETSPPIRVTNFNAIRIVAAVSGQIVYPIGFLNGRDIILGQVEGDGGGGGGEPPTPGDTDKPFVVSHVPVSGLSGVELNTQISVTFNEEILDTSVVSGSFIITPPHDVTVYRDVTDVNKIVMTPNINLSGSTVYVVDVSPTGVTDLAGNFISGESSFVFPFTTTEAPPPPDTTPPVVSGTNPATGASGFNPVSNVTVTFSEPMLSGSINTNNVYLSYLSGVIAASGIPASVVLSNVDHKTVTVDPTNFLSGSSNVKINVLSGVQDLAGNNMAAHDRSRNFTTNVLDLTPPTISGTNPANGATNVSLDAKVIVTFSEPMLSGTINASGIFLSKTSGGNPDPGSYSVALSGNQRAAAITPSSSLEAATYYINVLTSVQDLAENALANADRGRSFTTAYNYQQVYFVTGGGTGSIGAGGSNTRLGLYLTSASSALKGSAPKKIVVRLRKTGSPTGTYFVRIRKGTDDSIVHEFGSGNAASLTTSYVDYTFISLSQSYVLTTNDKILVEFTGGDANNRIEVNRSTSGDSYVGADYIGYETNNSYNTDNGKDIAFDIYK